jgi:hypothetical protein
MANVQPRVYVKGKKYVAGNDCLFRDRGPPRQAEYSRQFTLVHLGALCQSWVLCVLSDNAVKSFYIFQRSAHKQGVKYAAAIIAEYGHAGSRASHGSQLGKSLAVQANTYGSDGEHID